MIPQLILIILSFILIWLVFKMIYLDKNPFHMTRFWMVQITVVCMLCIIPLIFKLTIITPYIIAFLFILLVFKIFNWKKNPFKMMSFWVTLIVAALIVTAGVFFIVLRALGGRDFHDDNLANDIEPETITSIIIIQRKDTVHIDSIYPFVSKLYYVERSFGPVKYAKLGKMIFIRKNGSKDSISANGYAYGPYKGKWYQSEENVLEEYFKK